MFYSKYSSILIVILSLLSSVQAADKLPNVIFILADDIGWGDVSYNDVKSKQYHPGAGNVTWSPNPARTPNLDAMATDHHSLLLNRFYSGSPVCSPTRSSVLTGRTPNRECITGANGCGQLPAYTCDSPLPFPPTTFTAAEAAKLAGMGTFFAGKWHLGNFCPKPNPKKTFASTKWPVSHPGQHGFDEWHATEASASSSMCNCACDASWIHEGKGCVSGGGVWKNTTIFECTNYWHSVNTSAECLAPLTASRDCVANLTSKIAGDDSEYIMSLFEEYVKKQNGEPFLAMLFLHTNHQPHPSMPEWYHAYNDTQGDLAGDYRGTISQMDHQIGALREFLKTEGINDDTLIWFTTDNGPHPGDDPTTGINEVHTATNGMRQCKASVFEGGIRVPGIIHWPAMIANHQEIDVPLYTNDFLPTFLEIIGVQHAHPHWAKDGESLIPLFQAPTKFQRHSNLGWKLEAQVAVMEPTGQYKLVLNPTKGQCALEDLDYNISTGTYNLFDIWADPTESSPVNAQPEVQDLLQKMIKEMTAFVDSITNSAVEESQCQAPSQPNSNTLSLSQDLAGAGEMFQLKHVKSQQCLAGHVGSLSLTACEDQTEDTEWVELSQFQHNIARKTDKIGEYSFLRISDLTCASPSSPVALSTDNLVKSNDDGSPAFSLYADGSLRSTYCWPRLCLTVDEKNEVTTEACSQDSMQHPNEAWEMIYF